MSLNLEAPVAAESKQSWNMTDRFEGNLGKVRNITAPSKLNDTLLFSFKLLKVVLSSSTGLMCDLCGVRSGAAT